MVHIESPQGPEGTRTSAAVRAGRLVTAVLAPLVYPRSAEDVLADLFPLFSTSEVRAELVSTRRETADTTTLVLRPNALFQGHRAGQFVALTTEVSGVRRTRCFSIASAEVTPGVSRGRLLELTVKARPSGAVTPFLVAGARPGMRATLSQAQGGFTLPLLPPRRPLFVSGGSGITPVMSMLRTLVSRGRGAGVTFVYYARTLQDVIFRRELEEIAASTDAEILVWTDDAPRAPGAPRDVRGDLVARVPDFAERETFACGPPALLASLASLYGEHGATARLHTEAFGLSPTSAAHREDTDAPEVRFARVGSAQRGRCTLLALAETAGLTPKSGCRMGICHTCTCRKVSGVTRDVRTGALSTDADVDVQLCVSEPVSDVTLDL